MISTRTILMLILPAAFVGCVTGQKSAVVHHFDPVLTNTVTCEELVSHLNAQSKDLRSWRCMETYVYVSVPKLPELRLKGTLSCSAPSSFRLMADNFVAQADYGSNNELCWAYSKPGEPVVMTWRHEDSHLLEYVSEGFPRLDPEWLMAVLGVQPLDANDFKLQRPPAGSRDLWLVSVEDTASGQSLRRVIKVDTVTGFTREHLLVDHNGDTLLRAHLKNYQSCDGNLIPHRMEISFPSQKTDLTLVLKDVEANCSFSDSLWVPPGEGRIRQVDMGNWVRQKYGDVLPRPKSHSDKVAKRPEDSLFDGTPLRRDEPDAGLFEEDAHSEEPFFDDPAVNEPEFDDRKIPRGRFFGEEELEQTDAMFDPLAFDETDERKPNNRTPIHPAGFLEAPDFDVVAPPNPPRSRFRLNPFR